MSTLDKYLKIQRCPHCAVDNPNLSSVHGPFQTSNDNGKFTRIWRVFICGRCGGVVTASSYADGGEVNSIIPKPELLDSSLPIKVKSFLQQAIDSINAPSGAIMLCASAVDAMLKEKNYIDGSLYSRILKATENGLLTKEMELWAHEVRLSANDERHSDENAELPTPEDAQHCIEFTKTLAEFLFVLPFKIKRGLASSKSTTINKN